MADIVTNAGVKVIRMPDPATLAEQLADDIAERLSAGVVQRSAASLVVPGGTTPGLLFDALSRRAAPWERVTVTLNDERWVDAPDPASNEHLVRTRLLADAAAEARFIGLKTPAATAAEGVAAVEARLATLPRPFDVMLLGMGADGHTASLFPGSPALQASLDGEEAWVQAVAAPGARGSAERITMTLPALLDSRLIALLITGEDKLETLRRAQADGSELELPIRAVLRRAATPVHVYWSA